MPILTLTAADRLRVGSAAGSKPAIKSPRSRYSILDRDAANATFAVSLHPSPSSSSSLRPTSLTSTSVSRRKKICKMAPKNQLENLSLPSTSELFSHQCYKPNELFNTSYTAIAGIRHTLNVGLQPVTSLWKTNLQISQDVTKLSLKFPCGIFRTRCVVIGIKVSYNLREKLWRCKFLTRVL